MTKLDTYLRSDDAPTAQAFARAVGISGPYIFDLRRGRRRPSPDVAKAIERESRGEVPAGSWFEERAT